MVAARAKWHGLSCVACGAFEPMSRDAELVEVDALVRFARAITRTVATRGAKGCP